MPYKRNDSPYWWIFVKQSDGTRTRRSSGTTDFAAAKALEQQTRADAWKEKEWGVNPPRSFNETMLPYLRNASQHQRSYETTTHRVKATPLFYRGCDERTNRKTDSRAYDCTA